MASYLHLDHNLYFIRGLMLHYIMLDVKLTVVNAIVKVNRSSDDESLSTAVNHPMFECASSSKYSLEISV